MPVQLREPRSLAHNIDTPDSSGRSTQQTRGLIAYFSLRDTRVGQVALRLT